MFSTIEEVKTSVIINDDLISADHNGRLGIVQPGDLIRLNVTVGGNTPFVGFTVNEQSVATVSDLDKNGVSRRRIGVKPGRGNFGFCGYPQNHLCLALLGEKGEVSIVKTGLVTQGSETFLVTYKSAWEVQMFVRKPGRVYCPRFHAEWPTLAEVLYQAFSEYAIEFPTLPEGYKAPTDKIPPLPRGNNVGVVLWFELLRGIGGVGAIKTAKGDARVQWQQAPFGDEGALRYLKKDDLVSFSHLQEPPGKTQFKFDAISVELLV